MDVLGLVPIIILVAAAYFLIVRPAQTRSRAEKMPACPRCGSTRRYKKDTHTVGMGWMRKSKTAWACADCNAMLTGVTGSAQPMQPRTPPTQAISPKQETKSCPFCAETILAEARKCKHCGEFLN